MCILRLHFYSIKALKKSKLKGEKVTKNNFTILKKHMRIFRPSSKTFKVSKDQPKTVRRVAGTRDVYLLKSGTTHHALRTTERRTMSLRFFFEKARDESGTGSLPDRTQQR